MLIKPADNHQIEVVRKASHRLISYFEHVSKRNALPAYRAHYEMMLHKKETRDRLRKTIHLILDEGHCADKNDSAISEFIVLYKQQMEELVGVNPYRDAAIHLLDHLNQANMVCKAGSRFFWAQRAKRAKRRIRMPMVQALMHIYGTELGNLVQRCFPLVSVIFDREMRRKKKS